MLFQFSHLNFFFSITQSHNFLFFPFSMFSIFIFPMFLFFYFPFSNVHNYTEFFNYQIEFSYYEEVYWKFSFFLMFFNINLTFNQQNYSNINLTFVLQLNVVSLQHQSRFSGINKLSNDV